VDWLHAPDYSLPDEDYGYDQFYNSVDTTLMGHNTYKQIMSFDVPFPYAGKTNFVFSRSQDYEDTELIRFVSGDAVKFVRDLKKTEGKDIWLIGGGQINSLLCNHGLVDRLILFVFPVLLGQGIRLFDRIKNDVKFVLMECKTYENGIVQLTYDKREKAKPGFY
jgi:dihydrofolate reductase